MPAFPYRLELILTLHDPHPRVEDFVANAIKSNPFGTPISDISILSMEPDPHVWTCPGCRYKVATPYCPDCGVERPDAEPTPSGQDDPS